MTATAALQSTAELFQQLGTSVLLGMLVGLQRERTDWSIAGLRTFPLVTVLGALAAMVDQSRDAHGWLIAAGLLGVLVLVVVANLYRLRRGPADFGSTTVAALLLMYFVGAFLVVGEQLVAVSVATGLAVLLQFKPELQALSARLGERDLRAVMTFALISGVILPVLPNRTYDLVPPLNLLNPLEIWLMVVLIVGISLGGYLSYKFFGRGAGILLGGVLGGAISSTATTLGYARRTRLDAEAAPVAALVVVIASNVMFVRVMLELVVVARDHAVRMVLPVAALFASGMLTSVVLWFIVRRQPADLLEHRNPTELRSALLFALLYAGVVMGLDVAKRHLGGTGLYGVALVSGITDMDAIVLSTAHLVQLGRESGGIAPDTGWRLVIVAALANTVGKWSLAALLGHRRLRLWLAIPLALPVLTGALLLWLM